MPTGITALLGRLTTGLREFTVAQRTIALIGVAGLLLGAVALTSWLNRPTLTPLYSGLDGSDANAIVEQLRGESVSYQLTDGGSTILVPEDQVYDQRLKAAAAGLPANNSSGGYSLLDEMGVTSSEFQQNITYKRAIEGELAATIGAMTGVQTASVKLAIPEQTVFVDERLTPTASVFVQSENGSPLSADQVQSIVHLTSAAIEGMAPEDVAVVDAEGKVLSAVGVGATGSADQQASDYEQRTGGAVQRMLDQVVGPGNATVAVAADMNYSSAERLEETFTTPEDTPALNESSTSEEYEGTGGAAAGVLGPDNIAVPDGAAGEGTYSAESSTRNNAVNKVTETTTIPAGAVNRQTVSVAVDAEAAAGLDVAAVEGLVAAAAGIDADRGDVVQVEIVQFNTAGAEEAAAVLAAAEAAAEAQRQAELRNTLIMAGAIVFAVLMAGLLAWRTRRRVDREPVDLGELERIMGPDDDEGEGGRALEAPAVPLELPAPVESPMDRRRAEIAAFASADPDKTADYLRGLLDERQPSA